MRDDPIIAEILPELFAFFYGFAGRGNPVLKVSGMQYNSTSQVFLLASSRFGKSLASRPFKENRRDALS